MKHLLWLLVLLLMVPAGAGPAFAQKEPAPETAPALPVPGAELLWPAAPALAPAAPASATEAAAYLQQQFPPAQYGEFRLKHATQSPVGQHLLFQQYLQAQPVYGATVKLNLEKNGRVLSVFKNLHRFDTLQTAPAPAALAGAGARYLQQQYGSSAAFILLTEEPVWFLQGRQLLQGTLLTFSHPHSRIGDREVLLNATGQPVQERDLMQYFRPAAAVKDTTIRAYVFRPDPLTTAQQPYRSPYVDSADADVPALNQQRQLVDLQVWFRNDTFYLQNPYCVIQEFDAPVKTLCHDTASTLDYSRSNHCFEQVNILYHISAMQQHVQSLGFLNLQNLPIPADANGLNGLDQSRYSPLTNTLSYGEGGVDDGEDADVILHEYSHALSNAAAPGTQSGLERLTLEEANADYFAASYSYAASAYNWDKVFNWDGHNEYWAGRKVVSNRAYPTDLLRHQYYDAEIWSATIMQILHDLGRNTTDKLLLQSLYSYAPNLTMPQAAVLFLQADTLLHGGANATAIFHRFVNRGILKSGNVVGVPAAAAAPYRLLNSSGFSRGGTLEVAFGQQAEAPELLLTDITGRRIHTTSATSGSSYTLSSATLAPGIYLLHLRFGNSMHLHRLVRY